jgi:hypothetical protein
MMKKTIAVPFTPQLDQKTGLNANVVAKQIEDLIEKYADQDWEYLSIESVSSTVKGNAGCMSLGGTPDTTTFTQVIMFQK